jgi:hypothetical protein
LAFLSWLAALSNGKSACGSSTVGITMANAGGIQNPRHPVDQAGTLQ